MGTQLIYIFETAECLLKLFVQIRAMLAYTVLGEKSLCFIAELSSGFHSSQVLGEEFYNFINMRGACFLSFMLGHLVQMMCFEDRIDACLLFDFKQNKRE